MLKSKSKFSYIEALNFNIGTRFLDFLAEIGDTRYDGDGNFSVLVLARLELILSSIKKKKKAHFW